MSSPSNQGSPQERPKSISKFIRRASKVLRPRSVNSAEQASDSAPGSPMVISPVGTPGSAPQAAPLASNPPHVPAQVSASAKQSSAPAINTSRATEPQKVDISRDSARDPGAHARKQQGKATALFAKYGFSLETRDWTGSSRQNGANVDWVEKKIRVRVHRECHHCKTSFGSTKVCSNCDHVRCKLCPRWPLRRGNPTLTNPTGGETSIEKELKAARAANGTTGAAIKPTTVARSPAAAVQELERATSNAGPNKETVRPLHKELSGLPSSVSIDPIDQTDRLRAKHLARISQRRGADVIYRPAQHRVRRVCHQCSTVFQGRAVDCENCGHQRCPNCPRDPTKLTKFPQGLGYPGDIQEPEPLYPALERVWRKPRIRVRYHCHSCTSVFPSSNEKTCRGCKHSRCDMCTREPLKRQAREHNEELFRELESRLIGLRILPSGNLETVKVDTLSI